VAATRAAGITAAAATGLARPSISGLPLPWPVRIFGLAGRYPANYLIRRSPILGLHGTLR